VKLEHYLILNRYFHSLFKSSSLEKLKAILKDLPEGPCADGQSHFFRAIDNHQLSNDKDLSRSLPDYDRRIMGYEAMLAKARGQLSFKYFQYLCLLYSEIWLDRLTRDSALLLYQVNRFLKKEQSKESGFKNFLSYEADDLRRLAFFMATGSGKTLILHVHLWQILHYSTCATDQKALVNRLDGRPGFDNILLITPNEGLSRQHLAEFQLSSIEASLLSQDRNQSSIVKIVEIQKLTEAASKDGVSIVMGDLGSQNLVFVDEGHKGAGSEAQTWKNRQKALCANGYLVEYSATFAQSVAAVGKPSDREKLLAEYGKCILFDYAYRHFYDDGYGKDFEVLNLTHAREEQAFELLLGGLLVFYHQLTWYHNHAEHCRCYLIEPPLWIFLGSSVNAVYVKGKEKRSDVAKIVAFLKKLLEDSAWALDRIQAVIDGKSGFRVDKTHKDIFAAYLPNFKNRKAGSIYEGLRRDIFHGQGGLELWDLTHAEGEIGLRVSNPDGGAMKYFGIINIGDVGTFKKHLQSDIGIDVFEDRFAGSLFADIDAPDSPVSILIGSKKFVEGWSSWRVSAMGLLNMGKGEGPQVIQLFGRGIRLKGKDWSLKRSSALSGQHPEGLNYLEHLFIFGWNANYIQAFRNMLEQEDMNREIRIPVYVQRGLWKQLPVPKPRADYHVESETWTLENLTHPPVHVDLGPRVTIMSGGQAMINTVSAPVLLDCRQIAPALDKDALYADLMAYKAFKGYENVYIPWKSLDMMLKKGRIGVAKSDSNNPVVMQQGASMVLKTILDRFIAMKEREEESKNLVPTVLSKASESIIPFYTARVSSAKLIPEIEKLIKSKEFFKNSDLEPLPRLHVHRHLYSPILLNPADLNIEGVTFSPTGLNLAESLFMEDIHDFWEDRHNEQHFRHVEIYLLRNLPGTGVGFYRHSGFFPDFILWIKDKAAKTTQVVFVDPHGMHHGGLSGNEDKIQAMKELEKLSEEKAFQKKRITLKGFILTETSIENMPGAEQTDWDTLRKDYNILWRDGEKSYLNIIFGIDSDTKNANK